MLIVRKSPFSGEETVKEINVTEEQLSKWKDDGMHIQDAMPHLTADEREFILTGVTPDEWDEAFSDEDCGNVGC